MKKLFFLFTLSLLMVSMAWGQGSEDFENHSLSGTSYVDGSFVGNNSITWNYVQVTGEQDYPITNKGILLRRSGANSKIYSSTVSGGIGSFSVQMRKAFTGTGDRQVALYINSTHVADSQTFGSESGDDATIHTFSVNNINIAGDIVIEVRHITGGSSNGQLVLDNLTWTGYTAGSNTPPDAPLAAAATNVENDSFTANWSTVEGATGFKLDVYRMVEGGYATDLFISEYIEGSSSNKYIEIYNGTGSSVDLSNYKLELYSNGASTATNSVILSGSLEHDASVVYKNSSAALTLPIGVTATVNSAVNFSGNDAVALGNFGQHGLRAAGMREKLEQRGKESKS